MEHDTSGFSDLGQCGAAMQEWAKFGLEGLVIGGLMFLLGLVLYWQKGEREGWQISMDDLNQTMREICLSFSKRRRPVDLDDGK
ncbi:MAG: hypothetical protein WCL01_05745 [Comamonadaceae bacterium]